MEHCIIEINNQKKRQPIKKLCWTCGTSLEAWPLLGKDNAVIKYHRDQPFKVLVDLVRAGVEKARARLIFEFLQQSVTGSKVCGIRIKLECAFITLPVAAVLLDMPATSIPILKIVRVYVPDLGDTDGCVVRKETLPPKAPHYIAEIYSDNSTELKTLFLEPPQVLREGQAEDEWTFRINQELEKRPKAIKGTAMLAVPSWNKVLDSRNLVQENRKQAAETDQAKGQDKAQTGATVVITGSRLASARTQVEVPTAKSGAKRRAVGTGSAAPPKKKGTGAGAGGGGGDDGPDGVYGMDEEDANPFGIDCVAILLGAKLGREVQGVA